MFQDYLSEAGSGKKLSFQSSMKINGFLIKTCNTLAIDRNFSYLLVVFVNKNFKEILGSQNTLKPKLREVIHFSELNKIKTPKNINVCG